MSALHDLARDAGLQIDWEDALGEAHRVSDETLVAVLGALGFPAEGERAIGESRARLREEEAAGAAFVSATCGQPIAIRSDASPAARAELIMEDGSRRDLAITGWQGRLTLPPIDIPGYHRVMCGDREIIVAIAPRRCFGVGDAAPGRRIWGPAVQIPALRDSRDTAYGDFGTLRESVRTLAGRGADAVAISPVHALFPADPSRYSPYAPSSRLFLNVLYADPGLLGLTMPESAGGDLIDWQDVIPERLRLLRQTYDERREDVANDLRAFTGAGGAALEHHARFDALHAHFFAARGAQAWQDWPAAYRDPAGPAVASFAAEHADDVQFHVFLQWLAKRSLDAAQDAAKKHGMALGLIADLAVGTDPGGSHAWSRREDLLTGLSIGAPPDLLAPDGQSWGITGFDPRALRRTGFRPFIDTLRAALGSAGGIRIDHALGLQRLWIVPDGASAKDGAYLTMPMTDMFRLLAIESRRANAVVIGEDLGTVPESFRPAMDENGMLGMRVLPFERDEDGFIAPDRWSVEAAAMTGTHDLPTVAGWWQGRDIDWTWTLGRTSRAKNEADDRAKRVSERGDLWHAFRAASVTDADQPDPADTQPVLAAALRFVAETPCALAILPVEDVVGLTEQPNLPGTIDEHPNWRRRLPDTTERLLARPDVSARVDIINAARTA